MAKEKIANMCEDCHTLPVRVRNSVRFKKCDDCRRTDTIARLHGRRVKRTLGSSINHLIQYNEASSPGWRAGYLLNVGPRAASVQPIGGKNGICPSIIRVALADIKAEELQSATMPTVEDYYKMTDKKRVPLLVVGARLPTVLPAFIAKLNSEAAVQETDLSALHEQSTTVNDPKVRTSKHAPFDAAEAVRLYQAALAAGNGALLPGAMSAIVEAVRGTRAAGGTGNLVREACTKAGVYVKPTKELK